MRGLLAAHVKRRLLKEPEHPGSVGFLVATLLISCLPIALGVFGGFTGWLLPAMWVVIGLSYAARGIAETLSARRVRATAMLRAWADSILLGMLAYLVVATIIFNL